MFKNLVKILLVFNLVVGDFYAVSYCLDGLTYGSDLTFFLGMLGLITLVFVNFAFGLIIWRKYEKVL